MPKYIVECLSQYRVVYAIEANNQESAEEFYHVNSSNDGFHEFGQSFLGEMVVSSREANDDELIRIHEELNDYCKSWTREKKLSYVNKDSLLVPLPLLVGMIDPID